MSQDSDIIRVGKNAKVSALAERVIKQLERQGGLVRLEAVGAGAVNQAVKAVAQARRSGYLLAIIPDVVDIPLGHGSQPAVQLTVEDQSRVRTCLNDVWYNIFMRYKTEEHP